MSIRDNTPFVTFLTEIMSQYRCSLSQLAADLDIHYSTAHRWLHNRTLPNMDSCKRLADYANLSLQTVLSRIGYTPAYAESVSNSWPEFREYATKKYPDELDDDLITSIENLIAVRRDRNRRIKAVNKRLPRNP
jgi:transcriptional regulator with XRE-family HTH domain